MEVIEEEKIQETEPVEQVEESREEKEQGKTSQGTHRGRGGTKEREACPIRFGGEQWEWEWGGDSVCPTQETFEEASKETTTCGVCEW